MQGNFARSSGEFRIRSVIGTVDRAGNAQLFVLTEAETALGSQAFDLVTTQLTGKANTSNGVRISGALNRTGNTSANAVGTFTVSRTSTQN